MVTILIATSPWWGPAVTGAAIGFLTGLMF